ncbi:MAG: extracellular solute-binding protein, partial [Bradyrhizobium sp.]|nr:extracellular solute-binding protein [Bradyrhizobium sp.]
KDQFTKLTGINVEVEIVRLEQVLAKATQDVQGQLGTYDLYYLDQSWVATFAQDCIDPIQYTKDKPDLAMPGFDWDDFSKPLVEGLAKYDGKMVGVPFDIPIFILMYRQDILEKHGIKVPTNYAEFTDAVHKITEAEKANGMFGTGLQAKSGHYSLECDWTQAVWGHGGGIFGKDKKFTGNDEAGIKGLQWYQDLLKNAPANSTASTWDGQFQMMASGQCALVQSWDEFFPGLDADDSKVKGLWQPAKPLQSEAGLRVHPGRRLRADAALVLRRRAGEGQGQGRRRHHPSPRDGEMDHRQRDGLGAGYAALGRLFQQRDPDRAWQAADQPGLWRRRQEVHGRGGGHDRCQNERCWIAVTTPHDLDGGASGVSVHFFDDMLE